VPRQVQVEVNKKSRFRYRLNKLYATQFYERCSCADEVRVSLLRHDVDRGEAEALVQAQEKHARFFIVDEAKARGFGERQGLISIGTVRLLARLSLEGQIEDTRLLVKRLRTELKARIAEDIVDRAIATAPTPI